MCLGIPGKIIKIIDAENSIVNVDVGGVIRAVNISCAIDPTISLAEFLGQWVLVHVGFGMSLMDEQEALQTLAVLEEIGEIEDELNAMRQSDPETDEEYK